MREYAITEVHSESRLSKVIGAAGPVGFGDGESVGSAVFVGFGEGDGVGVGSGAFVGVGVATGFIATPLFQINFFPLLMQVYLLLATVLVAPTLLHFVPEIVAEDALLVERMSAAMSEPIRAARLEPAFT